MLNSASLRTSGSVAFVLSVLALSLPAQAQTTYTVLDLGTLGGMSSAGYALNASGQVAGNASVTNDATFHAFFYDGVTMHDLGTLGGDTSTGSAINAGGQVVGVADAQDNDYSDAVLWSAATVTDLGNLGGGLSFAMGINDSGLIAGSSLLPDYITMRAVLWNGTTVTDLGTLGGKSAGANAINSSGQVVGYSFLVNDSTNHAALWSGTTITDLGTFGGRNSVAYGINESGQATGNAFLTGDNAAHAFLYDGIVLHDLGTLGGQFSNGACINSAGLIVGYSSRPDGPAHAFFSDGTTMTDLNTLINPAYGWELTDAEGINDNGQIAGSGTINGQSHAVLLVPNNGAISGNLALEGVADLSAINPDVPQEVFHLSFRMPGTTTEVFGADVTLTATAGSPLGTYTVPNVPQGTFDIGIKGLKSLRVVFPAVVVGTATSLPDYVMPGGDANNDNTVEPFDFNILSGSFAGDVDIPGTGYDPAADFNDDGVIDPLDFNILASEYGNVGDL